LDLFLQELSQDSFAQNGQKVAPKLIISNKLFLNLVAGTTKTEADTIGIDLMARAGFDPAQSVELWRNMAALSGEAPPELASTHPSNQSRIANLQAHLADAERVAAEAHRAGRNPRCAP